MAQATIDLADAIELLRLHKLAHEGALARVTDLQLSGDDVRAYFSSVTENLDRLDAALCEVDRQLQPVVVSLQREAAGESPDPQEAPSPALRTDGPSRTILVPFRRRPEPQS